MKGAVAELLPVVEKSGNLQVDSEEKARSAKIKLSLSNHREKFLAGAIVAVNIELSAFRVECTALHRNWGEIL